MIKLRADIEHEDGSMTYGVIIGEFDSYDEAREKRQKYVNDIECCYVNIDIEEDIIED